MFTKIKATNFKAFEELDVELRPITVFLGPNNAGKSAILSTVRLLSQTILSREIEIPLLLTGMFGDFGTYKDVVHNNDTNSLINFDIGILDGDHKSFSGFSNNRESTSPDTLNLALTFSYESAQQSLRLLKSSVQLNNHGIFEIEDTDWTEWIGADGFPARQQKIDGYSIISFIPYLYQSDNADSVQLNNGRKVNFPTISQAIISEFSRVEYIGPIRSYPQRTYQFKGITHRRVGMNGENAFSILANSIINSQLQNQLQSSLANWLSLAEIASDVKINQISDRHFEILVQHPETGEYQNIADVGQGNSQIFPVIIGGEILEPYSTFLVEQPEIHLHPKAQAELGSFFHHLYKRNIQSLIETHSEHLILRLQQHVASGEIPPDDVAVYYVYADGKEKRVERLRLDELGRFIDEWPEGFFPQGVEEAKKLSRIRFEARAKRNGINH